MTRLDVAIFLTFMALLFYVFMAGRSIDLEKIEPAESARASILTCTVKSNIDGVITLNDDCKITVIGE